MALIDGNTRTIAGTDITIENVFICCTRPPIHVNIGGITEVTVFYMIYENIDKALANEDGNLIKIEGLQNRRVTFDYNRLEYGDVFDFIDIKMKEDIIAVLPNTDPDLITFVPEHVVE